MATCSSASSLQLLFEWLNAGDAKLSTSLFSWVNLHTVIYWYCSPLQQAGLPLVQQYLSQFEKLVMEHMPKLGQHFVEEMINPSMYASQWFITVFSYSFPFHLTLRVWDVFLYEGIKVVFQVGLALLRFCHDDLVKLPFEKLLHALRNFPEEATDPDVLLPMAFTFKVSSRLEELQKEYQKGPEGSSETSSIKRHQALISKTMSRVGSRVISNLTADKKWQAWSLVVKQSNTLLQLVCTLYREWPSFVHPVVALFFFRFHKRKRYNCSF